MSVTVPGSLLERVEDRTRHPQFHDVFLPLEDARSAEVLAAGIARIATESGDGDLTFLVDSATAAAHETMAEARRVAHRTILFGPLPEAWEPGDDLLVTSTGTAPGDRFLVALSSSLSLALVASQSRQPEGEEAFLGGGWTSLRPLVAEVAQLLLAGGAIECPGGLPLEATREDQAGPLRLMADFLRHQDSTQREIARAQNDLSSVLDILKVISAKRSAHDILYVFVERMASVVGIDRCSIVRVWGGEDRGHVLVSHEDETLADLVIDLNKYPEIYRSIGTRAKVLVNNVAEDKLTRAFAAEFERAGITSILVIPIVLFDTEIGSFFLRAARKGRPFDEREVNFCEIVSEAAASALERAHLLESIQKANERLEHLSVTDGLTGLYNHRYFRDRLQEEYDRSVRYNLPLSCLLIDIDDFKVVNDTYGHLLGDAVLKELAARTARAVRKNDLIARYGGEEFVGLLPQTNLEGALGQARRLLREVSEAPYKGLPPDVKVTVSIGLAVLDTETMTDSEALVRAADTALYLSKGSGKNRITIQGKEQP